MCRVRRVGRVLGGLGDGRRVDVVGALGVAGVDVRGGGAVLLLGGGVSRGCGRGGLGSRLRWGKRRQKRREREGRFTGSWASMELNCGGLMRPESRRYSSSVRMVLRERLAAAISGILEDCRVFALGSKGICRKRGG